jgi:adenylate cyclase class IV
MVRGMRERENIELKAADADPAASERACRALGAADHGHLHQRDTYFGVATGLLKLREDLGRGEGELIFYLRAHEAGLRSSSYWRTPATDPAALLSLLSAAHGVTGVVTKRRRLFLHRNVRIHLDEVDGLGAFIELESVLAIAGAESPAEAEALAAVVAALGLDRRETIAAYLELISAAS